MVSLPLERQKRSTHELIEVLHSLWSLHDGTELEFRLILHHGVVQFGV